MLRLRHTLLALGVLTPLATASPLRAEPPPAAGPSAGRAGDTVTQYAFDDDLVAGDGVSSVLEVLHVRKQSRSGSLVRARTSFVDCMLKSVEGL
jgi:hypothetical protein